VGLFTELGEPGRGASPEYWDVAFTAFKTVGHRIDRHAPSATGLDDILTNVATGAIHNLGVCVTSSMPTLDTARRGRQQRLQGDLFSCPRGLRPEVQDALVYMPITTGRGAAGPSSGPIEAETRPSAPSA